MGTRRSVGTRRRLVTGPVLRIRTPGKAPRQAKVICYGTSMVLYHLAEVGSGGDWLVFKLLLPCPAGVHLLHQHGGKELTYDPP